MKLKFFWIRRVISIVKNESGKTALHKAIKYDNLALALVLIKNGAKINIPAKIPDGDWPIEYADPKDLYALFDASFQFYNGGDVTPSNDKSIFEQQCTRVMSWSNACVTTRNSVIAPEIVEGVKRYIQKKMEQAGNATHIILCGSFPHETTKP